MEEAAKVIGGVAGELVFFMRSFMLGFLMRLGYEQIIFFRRVFRQPKLLLDVQDVLFWTFGSFLMFGLLFRENNGTPRLFSLIGIAAGMALYQLGPAKLTGSLFCKIRKKRLKMQRRCHAWRKKRLERRKMEKKRLKKTQKESMIKREDKHSRNKRGENIDRKDGSPKESQSQMDRTGTCDSSTAKRDDLDWWKQFGRAKRPESGTAAAPRGKDCRGKGAKQRTR